MRLAVKRLSKAASDLTASANDRTFNYEVSELSRLKHSNLIEILGYSNDVKESVCLIYPYFVNGNLEDRLQMRRTHHQEVQGRDSPIVKHYS
jgi:serine/threonine protein kinase